jgi:hypothetical protein
MRNPILDYRVPLSAHRQDRGQRGRSQLPHFTLAEKRQALDAFNISAVWRPDKPLHITGNISVEIVSSTQT